MLPQSRRILIIDDDPDLVQILTLALHSFGYEAASAGDCPSGMELCRRFKPDLILLDYHLPGATGAHLFESFRRNQATSRTPILFMSGEASPQAILSEIAGAEEARFIPKPIHLASLESTLREMLH